MSPKPVVLRDLAVGDVEEAIDYYLREAGEAVALGFVDSLEDAYAAMAAHPQAGSPRDAYELGLPSLRCWLLRRYPYLIFYVELEERIDVLRVLHAQRDIPAWMQTPNDA